MPLFKIESSGCKRVLINAESISQIIELAISKLSLPVEHVCKLALQEDGTEIDEDEVLIQLSQLSVSPIVISILSDTQVNNLYNEENNQNASNKVANLND